MGWKEGFKPFQLKVKEPFKLERSNFCPCPQPWQSSPAWPLRGVVGRTGKVREWQPVGGCGYELLSLASAQWEFWRHQGSSVPWCWLQPLLLLQRQTDLSVALWVWAAEDFFHNLPSPEHSSPITLYCSISCLCYHSSPPVNLLLGSLSREY